jgi:putative flippase GtrA
MMPRSAELRRFSAFFVNGIAVGLFCWALQLGLFAVMPVRTAATYFAASAMAYAIATFINFHLQQRLVFRRAGSFVRFVLVSTSMTLLVAALAALARALLATRLDAPTADRLGFALAAVALAPVSYLLVSRAAFARSPA